MIYIFAIWPLLGLLGFVLYCLNKNTRPKKIGLLMVACFTHTFFGLIGLLYGYICYSGRNNIKR